MTIEIIIKSRPATRKSQIARTIAREFSEHPTDIFEQSGRKELLYESYNEKGTKERIKITITTDLSKKD